MSKRQITAADYVSSNCDQYESGGICYDKAFFNMPCLNDNFCCADCDRVDECNDVCHVYQEKKKEFEAKQETVNEKG